MTDREIRARLDVAAISRAWWRLVLPDDPTEPAEPFRATEPARWSSLPQHLTRPGRHWRPLVVEHARSARLVSWSRMIAQRSRVDRSGLYRFWTWQQPRYHRPRMLDDARRRRGVFTLAAFLTGGDGIPF